MSRAKKIKISAKNKRIILTRAKLAAVAVARFWDALRVAEVEHDIEFDRTMLALEEMACDANHPASMDDYDHYRFGDVLGFMLVSECAPEPKSNRAPVHQLLAGGGK